MSLTNIVEVSSSKPFYRYQRQFALCESCFWSATILYSDIKEKQNSKITTSADNPSEVCPICNKDSVVLIPLQENEASHVDRRQKRA
jgi:hypothetical protein